MTILPSLARLGRGGQTKPLLDRISASPTAAVAAWRLRNAYAGSCLRVRRSSDNTEQDIGFSANGLDTASLLSFVGAGNGFVSKWYDQSGNARDFTQTTAASQAQIVSAGSLIADNGTPALRFTGASKQNYVDSDYAKNILPVAGYSAVGLVRVASGANASPNADEPPAFGVPSQWLWQSFGASRFDFGHFVSGSGFKNASVGSLTWPATLVAACLYDGSNIKGWANGGTNSSIAAGNPGYTGTQPAYLGAADGPPPPNGFDGDMMAYLSFGSAISLTDLNTIGGELASKGGIAWTTAT